jgi:hypothetical protein
VKLTATIDLVSVLYMHESVSPYTYIRSFWITSRTSSLCKAMEWEVTHISWPLTQFSPIINNKKGAGYSKVRATVGILIWGTKLLHGTGISKLRKFLFFCVCNEITGLSLFSHTNDESSRLEITNVLFI